MQPWRAGLGLMGKEKYVKLNEYYSFEYRVYDACLGWFLSVDPLVTKYLNISCYAFCQNRVIVDQDFEELECFAATTRYPSKKAKLITFMAINDPFVHNRSAVSLGANNYMP